MKILLRLSQIGAVLAVLVFIATFPVRANFAGRAQLATRIEQNNSDSLFGSAGTPLGDAQLYIVDDAKAFLPEPGEKGEKLLDENYLKEKGIYPLQLQTVDFFSSMARIGSVVAFVVLGIVFLLVRRKLSRTG